jgi:hypothetical protein
MSSWLPEELHAHALEQPGADAPERAAYLAMWVWQVMADDQARLEQQPQPQRQQEPQSQSHSQRHQQPQPQHQDWSSHHPWLAPTGLSHQPTGSLTFKMLEHALWQSSA